MWIEYSADLLFIEKKNWHSTSQISSAEELFLQKKKTSNANPNVSRFVFGITTFIITALSKLVSTQAFTKLLLTGHTAKLSSFLVFM